MIINNTFFDTENKCYCMGILNVTPDSFYDGSRYNNLDSALVHVEEMIRDGVDIIDIGGESTRPGYTPLSAEEEMDRVLPVIEAIRARYDIPLSLDTNKARVALAGVEAGAGLINDIGGLRMDEDMPAAVAKCKVPVCIMHNDEISNSANKWQDVKEWLGDSIKLAKNAGVSDEQIILDPGVGFGKGTDGDYEMMASLKALKDMGYPVLLGISRKSIIGNVLGVPKEERLAGTIALNTAGILAGVSFIRVHDVKEHVQTIKIMSRMLEYM